MTETFFDEQSEQSQIKAATVSKYFTAWAKIITSYLKGAGNDTSIQYIDLFAGPGRYKDGAKSTPVLILEQAVADPLFRENLITIFNDKDDANTSTLCDRPALVFHLRMACAAQSVRPMNHRLIRLIERLCQIDVAFLRIGLSMP